MSRQPDPAALERIYAEQRACAELAATDAGARLGLADWCGEEILMRLEAMEEECH